MKEYNEFSKVIKENLVNYECLYHRLILELDYTFKNVDSRF